MQKRADEIVKDDIISFASGSYGEVKKVIHRGHCVEIHWENVLNLGKFTSPVARMFEAL